MDMFRFHKFTIGHRWTCDFGCSEKEEEFHWLIKNHAPGDNSFGAPVTYSNSLYVGNGFGFQKSSGIVTLGVKDILHRTYSVVRGFEEADMRSLLGSVRSSNHTATRQAPQNPNEMHLQALNEFISERHGVLEEGWCVEFKRSMRNGELHAVYCAPDGKTFDSMPEVACDLGLMSNSNSEEPKNGCASLQRSHLAKGRKSAVLSMANSLSENNKILSGLGKDLSSDFNTMGCASKFENNVEVVGAMPKEISGTGPQQFNKRGKLSANQGKHQYGMGRVDGQRLCQSLPGFHRMKLQRNLSNTYSS